MGFFSIFKKNKNAQNIKITEHIQNFVQDTAVAVAFSEEKEHETALTMIDKTRGKGTILVAVKGDGFSAPLYDYALNMAKRLDYKLLALNVTDISSALPNDKKEKIITAFRESCRQNSRAVQDKAEKIGISFSNVIEFGNMDGAVAKLHAHYPGMRYVLTEPDPDTVRRDDNRTRPAAIPVFDLGSFQPSTA